MMINRLHIKKRKFLHIVLLKQSINMYITQKLVITKIIVYYIYIYMYV